MFKIKGLDKLTRDLDQIQKAFAEMDGELGSVKFDPEDPASIEAAVAQSEQMIDDRIGSYSSNSVVASIVEQMKENVREGIIERASEARLERDAE
ncbi:hypothetical protein [Rhizobium rhizogenes]|jgi:hypothetical protein|uniref:hypothetical protein n=1 Tax=Rhizobium rhizogenes TaxID=359 RepID=UPI00115E502D|nr:hypothetical protein [Rhizobium rhizogenes]NTF66248.1 hypothetical protein [Rhizobium rhizogenes]NTG97301.1 hypothetical protein [Rhizobium rhizogenes]NTI76577.1 hypothetical protein [Rhizobium rhizogenes]NTJ36380.1 hypothetical protein [Rhizobium rhizogenes]TRB19705.1 hypothetical protein EXN70_27780 [Rhizobium rhizogenes]